VKLVQTVIVFDRGGLVRGEGWAETYRTYSDIIRKMVNPPGGDRFTIRAKTRKLDSRGHNTSQWNRNGVLPIKKQFFHCMANAKWKTEQSLSLNAYLKSNRVILPLIIYPDLTPLTEELPSSVGDFDFAYETDSGFRTVIEWETGNISSSHRSLNKMCLALMGDLSDAGVLIVPSRTLYPHLTDRIGNWKELCPYLAFWQAAGNNPMMRKGLLAITIVEHDEIVRDKSISYIKQGIDGRSSEGRAKVEGV
jgi:Restriction endonuclease BamHI